jgi:threonine synthase
MMNDEGRINSSVIVHYSSFKKMPLVQRFYTLQCVACDTFWDESQTATVCLRCRNALDVKYDYDYIRDRLNIYSLKNSPLSALKYMDFYPIGNRRQVVSLDEGATPLHRCQNLYTFLGFKNLYVKDEGANPTGVFKDRGSMVEFTKALELSAQAVCVASTGNMAASVSAYAAISGLPCYVLVPEGTAIGKLSQTLAYGARVLQIRGTYGDAAKLTEKMAEDHRFYLAGDYAFRAEGQKSISYEIIEQLYWKSPDFVIIPMGCGTNLAAIWKGFVEFKKLGFIDTLPKLIGVQPEGSSTICEGFKRNLERAVVVEKPKTIASAVGIGVPQDDIKALRALRESKGYCLVAADSEILAAQQELAKKESIFVEPSAAIPIAILPTLLKEKILQEEDIIVCIATGNGLKDPNAVLKILPSPPSIEALSSEVDKFLKNRLYEIQGIKLKDQGEILFTQVPEKIKLLDLIEEEFRINLRNPYGDQLFTLAQEFEEKGKAVTRTDLQNLVETVLKSTSTDKILKVLDYQVIASKHARPKARVDLEFKGIRTVSESEGVGPVDAAIQALKKAVQEIDGFECRLVDYQVHIDTLGTDSVVKVSMTLKDKENNQVVAVGTSPDIIVASIEAFEEGYNVLYEKNQSRLL